MPSHHRAARVAIVCSLLAGSWRLLGAQNCGPFTDVPLSDPFCPSILQVHSMGISAGTSITTFGPTLPVTRQVLAAMLTRAAGSQAKAVGRRAALGQFWNTSSVDAVTLTDMGGPPQYCKSDGAHVWVSVGVSNEVKRVRASDGRVLDTWTGATNPGNVLVAMGKIYVAGSIGNLYEIDPKNPAGPVTTLVNTLGPGPAGMAFDGARIWIASINSKVLIVTPGGGVTTVTGFSLLHGIVYDGAHVWVTSANNDTIQKLDASGAVLDTVAVGDGPFHPAFDGSNIWVPNTQDNSVSVVNATSGEVVATLTGNGLGFPLQAAFDGERILVTNLGAESVSLWRAADMMPLGTLPLGSSTSPSGVCSDGIDFWIALAGAEALARF